MKAAEAAQTPVQVVRIGRKIYYRLRCAYCGQKFLSRRSSAKFCGPAHRRLASLNIPLRIAIDALRKAKNQSEVAKALGISRQRVSQIVGEAGWL